MVEKMERRHEKELIEGKNILRESRKREAILDEELKKIKKSFLDLDVLSFKLNMLSSRTKTIKLDIRTWDSLKSLKKENETFNDVIKDLLNERTKSIGNEDFKAIKYSRKVAFFTLKRFGQDVGYEFEYNDVKGDKSDFVLDLKIKKIFFGRKSYNPSEFFGVDNEHKHYSHKFLGDYLFGVLAALVKEFRVEPFKPGQHYNNLTLWRQLYYDYNLSEESFKSDIEEPLRLSEEEKPSETWKKRIRTSIAEKLKKEPKSPAL